ncbi:MAG: hypothetical protein WA746_22470 [Isosphaeraceae bacterium]
MPLVTIPITRERTTPEPEAALINFGVALFCCPEGAETGKPRATPWGF